MLGLAGRRPLLRGGVAADPTGAVRARSPEALEDGWEAGAAELRSPALTSLAAGRCTRVTWLPRYAAGGHMLIGGYTLVRMQRACGVNIPCKTWYSFAHHLGRSDSRALH